MRRTGVRGARRVSGAEDILDREGWRDAALPVMVFDAAGELQDMNGAAGRLMAQHADCVGRARAVAVLAVAAPRQDTVTLTSRGDDLTLELLAMPRPDAGVVLVTMQDRSLETSLKNALIDSRRRYRDLVELTGTLAWETDAAGVLTFVSRRDALGYGEKDLLGKPAAATLTRGLDDMEALPFAAPMPIEAAEIGLRDAAGKVVPHLVSAMPLFDEQARWQGARGVCRDVSRDRDRDRRLARALQRERLVAQVLGTFRREVEPMQMVATAVEAIGKGLAASGCQAWMATPSLVADPPRFELLAAFGECGVGNVADRALSLRQLQRPVMVEVEHWRVLMAPAWCRDQGNGLLVLWRFEDEARWTDGDLDLVSGFAAHVAIAIEQVHQHRRLIAIAQTDPLTGLLNRRGFNEEVRRRLARMQRSPHPAALMYVDLDNFKAVNDVHGHSAGDDVLVFVRDLLRNNTRPTDLVARVGGDEFVLWLDGAGRDAAEKRARLLQAATASLRRFSGDPQQPLGMSIGVVMYDPRTHESFEELVARADALMYKVKKEGKGGFAIADAPENISG